MVNDACMDDYNRAPLKKVMTIPRVVLNDNMPGPSEI